MIVGCAIVRFWIHAYDFRPNCTPLSLITFISININIDINNNNNGNDDNNNNNNKNKNDKK